MKLFRILGSTGFLLSYCLAVALGCFTSLDPVRSASESPESDVAYLSISTDHYSHSGFLPRSVAQSPAKGHDTSKWPDVAPGRSQQVAAKLWRANYRQYSCFSYNFPIGLRKADLIFPFHYFW